MWRRLNLLSHITERIRDGSNPHLTHYLVGMIGKIRQVQARPVHLVWFSLY